MLGVQAGPQASQRRPGADRDQLAGADRVTGRRERGLAGPRVVQAAQDRESTVGRRVMPKQLTDSYAQRLAPGDVQAPRPVVAAGNRIDWLPQSLGVAARPRRDAGCGLDRADVLRGASAAGGDVGASGTRLHGIALLNADLCVTRLRLDSPCLPGFRLPGFCLPGVRLRGITLCRGLARAGDEDPFPPDVDRPGWP